MYCALFDTTQSNIKRICLFVEAAAAIIHHSSASLTMPMALVGIISIDRIVLDPILILCMQHLIILLTYFHKNMYILVQVLLEIWLEWTLFSNYEKTISNHWTLVLVASGLLLSHWMWFISGAVALFTERLDDDSKKRKVLKADEHDAIVLFTERFEEDGKGR